MSGETVRILLDTDIGSDVDDAMALCFALRSPEIALEGVTTVYGDVGLRARIAMKLIALSGAGAIPVRAGIARPLLRERPVHWMGHEGEGILTDDDRIAECATGTSLQNGHGQRLDTRCHWKSVAFVVAIQSQQANSAPTLVTGISCQLIAGCVLGPWQSQ